MPQTTHNHNSAYLGITAKAADADKLDGIDSANFLRSNADDNVSGHTEASKMAAPAGHTPLGAAVGEHSPSAQPSFFFRLEMNTKTMTSSDSKINVFLPSSIVSGSFGKGEKRCTLC